MKYFACAFNANSPLNTLSLIPPYLSKHSGREVPTTRKLELIVNPGHTPQIRSCDNSLNGLLVQAI